MRGLPARLDWIGWLVDRDSGERQSVLGFEFGFHWKSYLVLPSTVLKIRFWFLGRSQPERMLYRGGL